MRLLVVLWKQNQTSVFQDAASWAVSPKQIRFKGKKKATSSEMHSLDLCMTSWPKREGSGSRLSFHVALKAMWGMRCFFFPDPLSESDFFFRKGEETERTHYTWRSGEMFQFMVSQLSLLSLGIKKRAGKKSTNGSHLLKRGRTGVWSHLSPVGWGVRGTAQTRPARWRGRVSVACHWDSQPLWLLWENGSVPSNGVIMRTVKLWRSKAFSPVCVPSSLEKGRRSDKSSSLSALPEALQAPWAASLWEGPLPGPRLLQYRGGLNPAYSQPPCWHSSLWVSDLYLNTFLCE